MNRSIPSGATDSSAALAPAVADDGARRLVLTLSAVAFGAFAVRLFAQLQTMGSAGLAAQTRTLLLMEMGNWLGWSVWAVLLVVSMQRLTRPPRQLAPGAPALVALAIVPMLLVPLLVSPVHWLVMGSRGVVASARHVTGHNLPTNALLAIAMVGLAHASLGRRRLQRLEMTAASLRAQLAESQLDTLRAQLNPHFLFNALNSIAVLARRGQMVPVEQMVTRLAGLLRHSLDAASQQLVPLRVELEALRHYVEIEEIRHGARLAIVWAVADARHDRLVPSFLLQPLVENAIHHGLTDPARPLTVRISASEHDGRLTLGVEDDGAGLTDRGAPVDGIGLGHTRARLLGLYGAAATLSIVSGVEGRGARVTIVIGPPVVAPERA